MSNMNTTETGSVDVDVCTAHVHATMSYTCTITLPDGTTATLDTITPDDRADVHVAKTERGWRVAWLTIDDWADPYDPIDNSDMGERYDWPRWPEHVGVDYDDARTAIDRVGIGQGRRVYFVDQDGHPRRDWTDMGSPRWTFIVPEDVPAESRDAYAEAVWAEWRAWAAGEVYVISWVELDADGVEIDGTGESIGGVIGYDYADDCVRTAAATGSF